MTTLITPRTRFMHIPRTGGMWVTDALVAAGVPTENLDRASPGVVAAHAGLAQTEDYGDRFTFAFVRHPLDWWRSLWGFRMLHGWDPQHSIDSVVAADDFNEFIALVIERLPGHFTERCSWYIGPASSPISFVGRYESLADDLVYALRRAGEPFDEPSLRHHPAKNASDHVRFPAIYDRGLARRLSGCEQGIIDRFYPGEPLPERLVPTGRRSRRLGALGVTLGRRRERKTLAARVAAFPRWHYEFDLGGVRTPVSSPAEANRHRQREQHFFAALLDHLGGTMQGQRVLDLGCNAGYWSLRSIEAGCEFVLGIDARSMHIEQARLVFEATGVPSHRFELRCGDLFSLDLTALGQFDVVLCLGLLYHVAQPVELMELIARTGARTALVDTSLSLRDGSLFEIRHDDLRDPRHAATRELVMWPTQQAVIDLAQSCGYEAETLVPRMTDWAGCEDYQRGERRAFLCARQNSL